MSTICRKTSRKALRKLLTTRVAASGIYRSPVLPDSHARTSLCCILCPWVLGSQSACFYSCVLVALMAAVCTQLDHVHRLLTSLQGIQSPPSSVMTLLAVHIPTHPQVGAGHNSCYALKNYGCDIQIWSSSTSGCRWPHQDAFLLLVAGVPVLHTGPGGTGAERGPGCLPFQPLQLCALLQDGGGCRPGPANVTSLSLFTLRCPKTPV